MRVNSIILLLRLITTSYYIVAVHSSSRAESCNRGEYLDEHVCKLCPAGRYGSTSTLTTSDCTAPCPRGFCTLNSIFIYYRIKYQILFYIGKYSSRQGMKTEDDCEPCPMGRWGSLTGKIFTLIVKI